MVFVRDRTAQPGDAWFDSSPTRGRFGNGDLEPDAKKDYKPALRPNSEMMLDTISGSAPSHELR